MTAAIAHEMAPEDVLHGETADTLFFGGARPNRTDYEALADFGLRKNYKLVVPAFDPARPSRGPIGFCVVITDGLEESLALRAGKLWKRNAEEAAVLIFKKLRAVVGVDRDGRLSVSEMRGPYPSVGYVRAMTAVRSGLAHAASGARLVTTIGTMPVVAPARTMLALFQPSE